MKKITETFLEFIEPALKIFGDPEPMTEQHSAACALGHVVWNATVMEHTNPGTDYLQKAKEHGGNNPDINSIIDVLAHRKKELFGSDNRLIGPYDIEKKKDGGFSLAATVVQPKNLQ